MPAKAPLPARVSDQHPSADGLSQADICACFNQAFRDEFLVFMAGGALEPSYRPAQERPRRLPERQNGPGSVESESLAEARICAREDFAPSALHEAAHWLIATPGQRGVEDYGHVYVPPPRKPTAQALFYAAELPVQALECWLSRRAGIRFHASADDPDCLLSALANFQRRVEQLAAWYDTAIGGPWLPPLALRLAALLEASRACTGCSGR